MDSNLTTGSILESTLHDRERREERQIEKITLKEARRYGIRDCQGGKGGRVRYIYAGHVFIYDEKKNRAITSYKYERVCDLYSNKDRNNAASGGEKDGTRQRERRRAPKPIKSGTRFTKPIMLERSKDHKDTGVLVAHETATEYIMNHPELWTSHTVIVVDMSGSMREDDVDGARCRADGVWTTLARNFCKAQLEDQSSSMYDIVSVITLRKKAEVVVYCKPLTWVLYNKLIDFRAWDNMKPHDHGFYMPALAKAEELLQLNNHGSCALSLMFFSDGKPSDFHKNNEPFDYRKYQQVEKELAHKCGELASQFGRRLNIRFIGMADTAETFTALQRMTKEAKEFGALATFHQPSLNTDSLSQIISSSVASSLSNKTELTSLKRGSALCRSVRMDVQRERQNEPESQKPSISGWRIFNQSREDHTVVRVWTWNDRQDDFAVIIDPRCKHCFKPVADSNYQIARHTGKKCMDCQACFFCRRCIAVGVPEKHKQEDCQELLKSRREGFLLGKNLCPLSYNVAWKRKAFGEGAERLAYKFRFTDQKGKKYVGPIMVAKESRFVEDVEESSANYLRSNRHSYHKTFMRTQSIASVFAVKFNDKLERLLPEDILQDHVPEIIFVKPFIFELEDKAEDKVHNVLVEPLIEGLYRKFSDNHGDLANDLKPDFGEQNKGIDLISAARLLGRKVPNDGTIKKGAQDLVGDENKKMGNKDDLGVIEEGEEDESEEDEYGSEESDSDDSESGEVCTTSFSAESTPHTDYLQAFSHYTYVFSGGKLMVVDLQGAFQKERHNLNQRKRFLLTDPAIHQRRRVHGSKRQFGRTDLGVRGIKAFFESHECNDVCRFLGLRDKKREAAAAAAAEEDY